MAAIERHHGLEDGRSLILVKGMGRFAIHDGLESGEPYYEAVVAEYEDEPGSGSRLKARRKASISLFRNAVSALQRRSPASPDFDADSEVSFRLAAFVQVDPEWRHDLLEMRSEEARLARLDEIFEQVIARRGPEVED